MGVSYDGVLMYGQYARDFVEDFEDVLKDQDEDGEFNYKGYDVVCCNLMQGHDEYNTIIGINCTGKTIDEIMVIKLVHEDAFHHKFGKEPELICEAQAW